MSETNPPSNEENPYDVGKRDAGVHGSRGQRAAAPVPPPAGYVYAAAPPREKGGILTKVASGLITSILLASLLVNVYLYILVQARFDGASETVWQEGDSEQRIVIIPVVGMIDDEMAGFVHRALADIEDQMLDDPDDPQAGPAAVVLRVDSGGGGVASSDRIWHDIEKFQQKYPGIPVVASFGSVAASGGYYISAGTDYIYAEPTCITGSIGVIAQAFTVQELMEKIGVTPQVVVAEGSPQKDVLNPFRAWNDKDTALLKTILNESHTRFVQIVAAGREDDGVSMEQAQQLASGLPFTASEALESNLVNEIGYLEDAVDKAVQLSGLSFEKRPRVTMVNRSGGLASLIGLSAPPAVVSPEQISGEQIRSWLVELSTPKLEYRWMMQNQ